ncbi:pyridoxamine 5'-phosphate oxidase family protein [Nostoc sp. FACHB-152]|uniref:HugZ family pyridoxamine 5'-phosphate oxidase n=1 Tax=unclassified Nostoc TaxID=2593658 RepID=UPI001685511F|nr:MULTISPECIES: pyridoxamine 5'-phosphate oxidase family protein [unclassified Nostoc]MBD2447958.1 pyridoxamine 5'-phosphate oxidase family protein [Nostoc sp. FACHB-152]MBD2466065.1 pyridoxamine 5'-phosphate oxidase family protein [Nostoc sp. FACHB-145]
MSQLEKAQAEYASFPQEFQSVIISTISQEGIPNSSYAPFVMDEAKNIYIYISDLATHTQNLYANPRVSVLFIDDEAKTNNIFARRRLSFDCTATLIARDTDTWNTIVDQFQERFGEMIAVFRGLTDFRLFKLTPNAGRYVVGFGTIYNINEDNLNELIQVTKDNAK